MSKIGTEMPSLEGATEWFNATGARAEAEAKGHPTLVHFWSVSCRVCKDQMHHIAAWREMFADLRVIAVHMPRKEDDTDTEKVREAVALNNITEPCAVDNEHKLRAAFQNEQGHVPAYYLYDAEGKLRSYAAGERGLSLVWPTLERLIAAGKSGKSSL